MACNNSGRAEGIFHAHTGAHHMPSVYTGGHLMYTQAKHICPVYMQEKERPSVFREISCVAHGIYHSLFIGSQFIQGDIVYEV